MAAIDAQCACPCADSVNCWEARNGHRSLLDDVERHDDRERCDCECHMDDEEG